MIPITSFAGKKVAVFGLGGSGLIASSALFAGGADVVGWDDSAARIAHAASAGIPTADLRDLEIGLGGSGLIASSALFAGGADVVGWDDSAARIAHAASAGIPTADLREL